MLYVNTALGTNNNQQCGHYTQVVFLYRFNNMESIPLRISQLWSL